VQVDPIKPTLKAPGTRRLKLKYYELLSSFAFNSNVRRFTRGGRRGLKEADNAEAMGEAFLQNFPLEITQAAKYNFAKYAGALVSRLTAGPGRGCIDNDHSTDVGSTNRVRAPARACALKLVMLRYRFECLFLVTLLNGVRGKVAALRLLSAVMDLTPPTMVGQCMLTL
jgi:hypothetical protein